MVYGSKRVRNIFLWVAMSGVCIFGILLSSEDPENNNLLKMGEGVDITDYYPLTQSYFHAQWNYSQKKYVIVGNQSTKPNYSIVSRLLMDESVQNKIHDNEQGFVGSLMNVFIAKNASTDYGVNVIIPKLGYVPVALIRENSYILVINHRQSESTFLGPMGKVPSSHNRVYVGVGSFCVLMFLSWVLYNHYR